MKKLVLFFILTSVFSFELLACKAAPVKFGDVNDIEFMSEVLNEAQNIYFGEIANDNREFRGKPVQIFKVKKIWKSDQPGINAQKWFMSEMQILNKRYGKNDFVSSHGWGPLLGCPTYHLYREEVPNKYYLYIDNTKVHYTIPIEKAAHLVMKLRSMDTGKNFNPSLQFCKSDSQCTKLSSKCSIAINRDFSDKFNAILSSLDEKLCNSKTTVKSKCVNWFCE